MNVQKAFKATEKALKGFCSKEQHRPALLHPFKDGNDYYSTDGYGLIKVTSDSMEVFAKSDVDFPKAPANSMISGQDNAVIVGKLDSSDFDKFVGSKSGCMTMHLFPELGIEISFSKKKFMGEVDQAYYNPERFKPLHDLVKAGVVFDVYYTDPLAPLVLKPNNNFLNMVVLIMPMKG